MAEKIVRVYEVVEAMQNEDEIIDKLNTECDSPYFVLKEYIQRGKDKVATGRTFPIDAIVSFLEKERLKNQMCAGLKIDLKTNSFVYQYVTKKGNLKPDCASNLKTDEMDVIIPGNINEKYLMHQTIWELREALDGTREGITRIRMRHQRLKAQKIQKYKKAVGVVAAIAGATYLIVEGVPAAYHYIENQQRIQRQLEIDFLKQLGPTHTELQQMDDYSELNQWDVYFEQQREEDKKYR